MPSPQLFQIVPVSVPSGGSVVFAHNININGIPVKPDRVEFDQLAAGLTVDPALVTTTTFTAANPTGAQIDGNVLLEAWHSSLRGFGAGISTGFDGLSPRPFVVGGGGSGSSSGNPDAFVYIATGLEGTDFTVTLPVARANDNYAVFASPDGVALIPAFDLPNLLPGDRTTVDFRVITTAALTAGDRIAFFVFNF